MKKALILRRGSRACVVCFFVMAIGSLSGVEHGVLTWARAIPQSLIFLGLTAVAFCLEQRLDKMMHKRKRAGKRLPAEK